MKDDNQSLKIWTKRLVQMINSGIVDGNRLHDIQQTTTFKTVSKLVKKE